MSAVSRASVEDDKHLQSLDLCGYISPGKMLACFWTSTVKGKVQPEIDSLHAARQVS